MLTYEMGQFGILWKCKNNLRIKARLAKNEYTVDSRYLDLAYLE